MPVLIIEQISAREAGEISHMCFLNLLPMQAFAFIGFCLDLFYDKVNVGRLCIPTGKIVKMGFEGQNLQEMGK